MKSSRVSWIDYARGIAIILVCYRHVFEGSKEAGIPVGNYNFLEYINIFLYSFRMPLFFIISGIFITQSLQKKGIRSYLENRARSILYPYFVWGFIQLSLQIIFTKYTNGHPTIGSYLNLFYLPREVAQFWYLYALFNVSILYALSKYYLKFTAIHNMILGIILFYISSVIYNQNIKTGPIFDIFHYYIFFSIGDFVSNYLLDQKNKKYFESGKSVLLMCIPFICVQIYFLLQNLNHSTSKYMYVEFRQPIIFLFIALVGCAFVISLTFYLQKKNTLKFLLILGKNSLYIYVVHVIVFACVRIILSKFFGIQNVAIIIISGMFSGLLIPILLYKLAVKFNLRFIFTLEKSNQIENGTSIGNGTSLPTHLKKISTCLIL
jgi:fucose 4-O-acetylase-like acetyltransferase